MKINCFQCRKDFVINENKRTYYKVGLNQFCSKKCAQVITFKFLIDEGYKLKIWRIEGNNIKCVS